MADLFNKHIKKATARTKEKLLESVGKANRTQDEAFDFHASNLTKQAKSCERLHKDLKAYCDQLKKCTEAEKNLRESVRLAYEAEWPDREHVVSMTNTLDCQSEEYEKKVTDELMGSVTHYVGQFADLKKKVDKRGRKLVDYDSAKNNFNSIKASSKKGESDPKLTKAFTELQNAEAMYKEINSELLEVLPATYDSRITFLVDTLQTLFNAAAACQGEGTKLHKQLVSQLDSLGNSMDALRVARPEGLSTTPVREESPSRRDSDASPLPQPSPQPQASPAPSSNSDKEAVPVAPTPTKRTSIVEEKKEGGKRASVVPGEKGIEEECENKLYPKLAATPGKKAEAETKKDESVEVKKVKSTNPFDDDDEDDAEKIDVPVGHEGRKILYTVNSTHDYVAVDTDELSFTAGECIKVLESKAADNLDEGWQMGQKDDGSVGVFPENFTKKH